MFFCRTFLQVGIPYSDIFLLLCLECPRASLRESPMCSLKIKSAGSAPPRTLQSLVRGFFCSFICTNNLHLSHIGPQLPTCSRSLLNVKFWSNFFKSLRFPKAEPWSPPQRRNSLFGIFFLLSFFFCAFCVKRKSGKQFSLTRFRTAWMAISSSTTSWSPFSAGEGWVLNRSSHFFPMRSFCTVIHIN